MPRRRRAARTTPGCYSKSSDARRQSSEKPSIKLWLLASGIWRPQSNVTGSEALEVLGHRRLGKEPADQVAELLDLVGLAEVDHVRVDALPPDQEVVAALGLHAALHLVRNVALHAAEDRLDLGINRLELLDVLGLDMQYRDFQDHVASVSCVT